MKKKTVLSKASEHVLGNTLNLKQSYAAVFFSILTSILAGLFLGKAEELLRMLPGLIVLVPAALGMRGNIFSAMGSRLGSAMHMGTVSYFDRRNPTIKNNIYASMALTVIFSVVLAILAKAILFAFGFESISIIDLILISFIGGILSGIIMLLITISITFLSFRKGWDPDNVTSPMITAFGDLFTVPTLMVGAIIVMNSNLSSNLSILIIALGIALLAFLDIFIVETKKQSLLLKEASYRQIVIQSTFILLFTLFLDSLSGIIIQFNLSTLVALPVLLVMLPAFLEEGGNVGNIMAARLSTKLHLGTLEARMSFSNNIKLEFLNAYVLAIMIFFSVGLIAFLLSFFIGIGGLGLMQILSVTLTAGLMLTTIVVILTFAVSVLSYRMNIDPDNVTIPVITSAADVVGVFCLLFVLHLTGIA
ncbi:MAG: magnesium transporter [Candidatus Aenigmarchaeota archaeon]|nr:magnesium transporter [Candidatus Aenigmarchaeota archaeon]